MRGQMKLKKRTGIYQSSNVTFNPETLEAYSYKWWLFVKNFNGIVVFNNYSYSMSTCRHQSKVRELLNRLGVQVHVTIEAPKGLQDLEVAEKHYKFKIESLYEQMNKKGTRKAKNAERLETVVHLQNKLNQIQLLKG